MPITEIFEVLMLVCFGAAWPVSIYKSYVSGKNEGKSVWFLLIIFLGYVNGILFQYLMNPSFNLALFVFFVNAIMVAVDILLYYRNFSRQHLSNIIL